MRGDAPVTPDPWPTPPWAGLGSMVGIAAGIMGVLTYGMEMFARRRTTMTDMEKSALAFMSNLIDKLLELEEENGSLHGKLDETRTQLAEARAENAKLGKERDALQELANALKAKYQPDPPAAPAADVPAGG